MQYNHIFLDVSKCQSLYLSDISFLKNVLLVIVKRYNLSVIGTLEKRFEPQGASVILQLEESHITIHTWPEKRKIFIDIFASAEFDMVEILDFLEQQFKGKCIKWKCLTRG